MTLLFRAAATWWIPMLLILGFWRHVTRRFPLTYNPLYWGAVFPLGMYTVCTYRPRVCRGSAVSRVDPENPRVRGPRRVGLTFVGLVRSLLRPSALRPA
ncbi:MAG: hypothetical protein ABR610_12305 [Thermoanaerobaculia bacterium]